MRRRNVAYIRVAHKDNQAVERQMQLINNYAANKNVEIDHYYIDNGYSGTNLNRPQLMQMLKDVKGKKITDSIFVLDCSRLGRNRDDIEIIVNKISKRNVKLLSTIEMETTIIHIMSAVCNCYR